MARTGMEPKVTMNVVLTAIQGGHTKLLLECTDIQGDWTQM